MQLGGQFGAGCPRTDDRYVKLAGTHRLLLRIRSDAGIHKPPVETHRLGRSFKR
jgi:hypothetical protein